MANFGWGNQTGSWNVASNWTPASVPGSSDTVFIGPFDMFDDLEQTISGTGQAAALFLSGAPTLAGDFAVSGDVTIEVEGHGGTRPKFFGSLAVDGGTLTMGGTLTVGGVLAAQGFGLQAVNGAAVQASNLTLGATTSVSVDAASSMEIGNATGATAGEFIIGSNVSIAIPEAGSGIIGIVPAPAQITASTLVIIMMAQFRCSMMSGLVTLYLSRLQLSSIMEQSAFRTPRCRFPRQPGSPATA